MVAQTHQTANLCSKLNCASLPRPQGRAGHSTSEVIQEGRKIFSAFPARQASPTLGPNGSQDVQRGADNLSIWDSTAMARSQNSPCSSSRIWRTTRSNQEAGPFPQRVFGNIAT